MQNKKETNALLIGLGLIIVVIFVTFARGNFFGNKKEEANSDSTQQAKTESGQKYQVITPPELQKKIVLGEKINLLDIRSFDDYINEHIIDSVNVPIEEFPVGDKIDIQKPVVIITTDLSDRNIDSALNSLKEEHINNVQVLAGGMIAWKQLVGLTVTFGDPKSFVDQSKVAYVEADKLAEALKNDIPTFILDVRTEEEYNQGHIKGSKNIPFTDLEKRRKEIQSYSKMVIVGINELQEFQASVQLYDMILTSPFVLKAAIPGWQQKGFELVK